jgi:hypothetical protein
VGAVGRVPRGRGHELAEPPHVLVVYQVGAPSNQKAPILLSVDPTAGQHTFAHTPPSVSPFPSMSVSPVLHYHRPQEYVEAELRRLVLPARCSGVHRRARNPWTVMEPVVIPPAGGDCDSTTLLSTTAYYSDLLWADCSPPGGNDTLTIPPLRNPRLLRHALQLKVPGRTPGRTSASRRVRWLPQRCVSASQ